MKIWVVGALNQPIYERFLHRSSKIKFFLAVDFDNAVLNGNVAFSTVALSRKKTSFCQNHIHEVKQ